MMQLEGALHAELKSTPYLPATLSLDRLSTSTEEGMRKALHYWVEKVLKDKFQTYAAAKYGFLPRSPKYQRDKAMKEEMKDRFLKIFRPIVKPPQAFVLFGDLKKDLVARPAAGFNHEITATASKTELTIKVRSPHPMRRNQWLELKQTQPFQVRAMVRLVADEFTKGLQTLMAA